METRKAWLMVRSQVPNASDREEFDKWYGGHHLPLAMDKLRAEKSWRFRSGSDPSVHYALYQLSDMAALRSRIDSADFKLLVDDFNAAWPQVERTRDLMELVQEA
jgi:hypothetical protein